MKYLLISAVSLALVGCAHKEEEPTSLGTPVRIPEMPSNLAVKAKPLPPITDNTMGGLVIDGTNTDMKYNEVAHQLNNLIDLYDCVKLSINEKKDINTCLR
jgi:hypothetical protein